MRVIRCSGGCGKKKETPTFNKSSSASGHTTMPPWTCEECAARIARRAGKKVAMPAAKDDPPFRLVPRKQPRTPVQEAPKPEEVSAPPAPPPETESLPEAPKTPEAAAGA